MRQAGFPWRALFEHKGGHYEVRAESQGEGLVMVTILDESGRPVPLRYGGAEVPASVGVYAVHFPQRPGSERAFSELVTDLMAGAAKDVRDLL